MIDFYGQKLPTLKAALHSHSTVSDGRFTPDKVVSLYAERGYDVLAFTDHYKTGQVSALDDRGMTLLSGIELHPAGPREILWHLLALNVPEDFVDCSDTLPQAAIDQVNACGGICFVAHPYWSGITATEVLTLKNFAGIEVYNTSTRYIGKAYNMQLWDEILDAGGNYTAIAVDDIHRSCDLFRGWTMIATSERTPRAIIDALQSGRFYASQGPEFKRLSFVDGVFTAEFTPCREAIILSNRSLGHCGMTLDLDGVDAPEKVISSIRFDAGEYPAGSYLRCQICDREGRYAWSNPVRI